MIDWLIELDKKLFLLIHNGMSNSFFDFIMPWIRNKYFWIPIYIVFILLMIYYFRKKSWLVILSAFAVVGIADFISSGILKPMFHRLRPFHNPDLISHIHQVISFGSGFSFVSSHAANHYALAVFIGIIFKEKINWLFPVLLCWATLICFAQVYVAYHYPADIVAGSVVGIIPATFAAYIVNYWLKKSSSHLK